MSKKNSSFFPPTHPFLPATLHGPNVYVCVFFKMNFQRFIADAQAESIRSSNAPVPISTLKKRKYEGKMIRHSPKSIKINENDGPIPSLDEEAKQQQQQAVVLECKRTMDHNHLIPSPSMEGNIDDERTATMKSMVRDTKVLLRILSLRDREKLVQLHIEALSEAG